MYVQCSCSYRCICQPYYWKVLKYSFIFSLQLDTVFNMKRPYDLVAFMRQEERSGMLDKLKDELLSRKDEIDKNEDRDTGIYM